jgi:hypothetical protein
MRRTNYSADIVMWITFVALVLGIAEQKVGLWMGPVFVLFVGAIIAREDVNGA